MLRLSFLTTCALLYAGMAAHSADTPAASKQTTMVSFTKTTDTAQTRSSPESAKAANNSTTRLNLNDIQASHQEKASASLSELRQKGRILERSLAKGLAAVRRGELDATNATKIAQAGRAYERSYDRTLSRCAYAGVIVPDELVALRPLGATGDEYQQALRLVAAHLARSTRAAAEKVRFTPVALF